MVAISSEIISMFQAKKKKKSGGRGEGKRRCHLLPSVSGYPILSKKRCPENVHFQLIGQATTCHIPCRQKAAGENEAAGDTGSASLQCVP